MTPTAPTLPTTETSRLADQLERSFRGGAWQGPSIAEALAGVTAARAHQRPLPGAHDILELVFHIAFWLDGARRRIAGEAMAGLAPLAPDADWAVARGGEIDPEAAWRAALARLEEAHRSLHATVLELDDERLDQPVAGSDPTLRGMLLGVLQHNAYHAGQIALLAKADGASAS